MIQGCLSFFVSLVYSRPVIMVGVTGQNRPPGSTAPHRVNTLLIIVPSRIWHLPFQGYSLFSPVWLLMKLVLYSFIWPEATVHTITVLKKRKTLKWNFCWHFHHCWSFRSFYIFFLSFLALQLFFPPTCDIALCWTFCALHQHLCTMFYFYTTQLTVLFNIVLLQIHFKVYITWLSFWFITS